MTKPSKSTASKSPQRQQPKAGNTVGGAGSRPGGGKANRTATGASTATAQARKVQSRKIVNKRQTPWGLIAVTVVVVLLAVGVIGYAVSKVSGKSSNSAQSGSTLTNINITGIQHYTNLSRTHKTSLLTYPQSPPVGGDHSPVWADCTGTVYPNPIANENGVHSLEHGAVWITYKPGLPADQLDTLTKLVAGKPYMLLSPYDGLKSNISLQAWGYQLPVDSASDPRVQQFISDLRVNQKNTPELGASCDNPAFKTNPSTPGHPTES